MKLSTPKFVQGIYEFTGNGYDRPTQLATYRVASDRRAQFVYLRAGNSSDQMIVVALSRGGEVMRYFPVGARASQHVPLAVVEDIQPDTEVAVSVAAPAGTSGTVVIDFGLVEV